MAEAAKKDDATPAPAASPKPTLRQRLASLVGRGKGNNGAAGITLPAGATATPNADGSVTINAAPPTAGANDGIDLSNINLDGADVGTGGNDASKTGSFASLVIKKEQMGGEAAVAKMFALKFPHPKNKGESTITAVKIPETGAYELHAPADFSRKDLKKIGFREDKAAELPVRPTSKDPKPFDVWEVTETALKTAVDLSAEDMNEGTIADTLRIRKGTNNELQRGMMNVSVEIKPAAQEGKERTYVISGIEPGTPRSRIFSDEAKSGVKVTHHGGGPKIITIKQGAILEKAAAQTLNVEIAVEGPAKA